MLAIKGYKGCPRCGGDLFVEQGVEQHDQHVNYVSCLLCGELSFTVHHPARSEYQVPRGRPGRPRKVAV
jgi:hypothetical protein